MGTIWEHRLHVKRILACEPRKEERDKEVEQGRTYTAFVDNETMARYFGQK